MKPNEFLQMLAELVSKRIINVKSTDIADFILFCNHRGVILSGGEIVKEDGSQYFYV